jgi:ArsR family transcriptional regulator, arsenate/arsenite/antimonite-responsive transcriptional repressor
MNMRSYKCCDPNSKEFTQITKLASLLKLIGEENRLKLLCLLNNGERCVCEIPEEFEMSQSLISHHLADLKKAELVNKRKKGRRAYYSLTKKGQEVTNHILALVN